MANLQSWEDFGRVIGSVNRLASDIKEIARDIERLEELKAEIIDDTERKAELIKIFAVHPDYSVTWFTTRFNKLKALKAYLEDNGYL